MRLEFFISWRYLASRRKEKFISLISCISVLGVAIGVMALIVVISVMSGFDKELHDKIVGNFSHITVSHMSGSLNYDRISKDLKELKNVAAIAPQAIGQVLILESGKYFVLGLKGIDPAKEAGVSKIKDYITHGSLEDLGRGSLIIGKELADYLGLVPGDQIRVYSHLRKPHDLMVKGIFYTGMGDYDMNLVFSDLKTAQELFGLGQEVTNIAMKLDNLYLAKELKADIHKLLGFGYLARTWSEVNRNFFAALKLEKLVMFIILALIVLVAAFNIISTLIVITVEKTKDIGILKAIGISRRGIRKIFIYKGLIIGFLGVLLGASGGLLACLLLKKYQFIRLPQDIYYLEYLPVSVRLWPDITLIVLSALGITLISTVYPACKAAGLKPAEALRYE